MMDPKSGEILAMDTSTRYDLNNPYDLSAYYSQEEIDAMDEKAKSDAWYKLWRNFCVNDTYEPGSPQKAFTVAGALEENIINGNESFDCGGFLSIGGHDIHCVSRFGHGPTTVVQGLMKSCNVVMMNISRMEGTDIFAKYQSIFGFGQKTGIDLPGEADAATLIYTAENMGPADLATNSFGQNYNCTMIQMAAAYASLINGGSYYEPHVMKQILNEQGSVVEKKEPVLVRETVSQSTSDFLKEAMFQTVETGTGKAAQVIGYDVGGKTGTAEKQPRSAKNYLVSFAGFAPIEDPQVFVYVVIDTPNYPPGEQQAHSSYASAVFSKIMTEILPYLNIFPTKDLPENEAIQESLPSSEGINEPVSETEGPEGTEEAETEKQYETDEYMPGGEEGEGAGSGVPDAVPTVAGDGNGEGTGPSSLPVKAPPRQSNESSTQAGPAGESTQATEPSSAGETAKPSE